MGETWKKLWIFAALLFFVTNVQLQSDEGNNEWFNDDYEDMSDNFDDIFNANVENVDDYQELLKKINEAKDREYSENKELVSEEQNDNNNDINLSKSDPELQIEDDRFMDIPEDDSDFEDSVGNVDAIGDHNMNGNAPANDFDPEELEKSKYDGNSLSASEQLQDESDYPKESPYAKSAEVNNDIFDTDESESEPENRYGETVETNDESIEHQLEKIFKETQNILNNDDDSDNFDNSANNDESNQNNDIPKNILDETRKILNEDSNVNVAGVDSVKSGATGESVSEESYESRDMMYDDLNEDLKNLLATIDKIQNSNEVIETAKVDKAKLPYEMDDLNRDQNEDDSEFEELETALGSRESSQPDNADSEDSSERDKRILAELNVELEKQLKDIENSDVDVNDDYQDFYDDDDDDDDDENKDNEIDIAKFDPIPYGNDAIDPKEAIDDIIDEARAESSNRGENGNDAKKENISPVHKDATNSDDVNDELEIDNPNIRENANIEGSEYENGDKLNELSSGELELKLKKFKAENEDIIKFELALSENAPIDRILKLGEYITETSPNHPGPYEGPTIVDWYFHGEGGSGIELNITYFSVDGKSGDYLLVKPGRADAEGTDGLIFSYMLRTKRMYRFFDVDTLFVRFEAKGYNLQNFNGCKFSVGFIAPKVVRNMEPEPEPEPAAQPPVETLTVYLRGVTHHEYKNISEEFRLILVDMASMYVNRESIDEGILPLEEVTQITRISACNIAWPYHEACSAVTFGVPLFYNDTDEAYQLTEYQLEDMWMMYSRIDPFATRLTLLGITEYDVPNNRAIVSTWWLATFVVLLLALSIGFGLWRCNCFQDYNGMTRLREDVDSIGSARKSDLSLYPTPHQDLPPMFADGQHDYYLDGDYGTNEDTTRVDMGGAFNNKNFVGEDDLTDLDFEEEVVMSFPDERNGTSRQSYSSGIRPRDVFDV